MEPVRVRHALEQIRELYEIEREIAEKKLEGEAKLAARGHRSKPLVDTFFAWLEQELVEQALLPTNPFTKAALYALERKKGLEVFLSDPDVPIDTNHLERALRPIPMGRKAQLFRWTEVGAGIVGILRSPISTCGLHDVDPCTYLVDVLQRIDTHPYAQVEPLTPRARLAHGRAARLRRDLTRAAAREFVALDGGTPTLPSAWAACTTIEHDALLACADFGPEPRNPRHAGSPAAAPVPRGPKPAPARPPAHRLLGVQGLETRMRRNRASTPAT